MRTSRGRHSGADLFYFFPFDGLARSHTPIATTTGGTAADHVEFNCCNRDGFAEHGKLTGEGMLGEQSIALGRCDCSWLHWAWQRVVRV